MNKDDSDSSHNNDTSGTSNDDNDVDDDSDPHGDGTVWVYIFNEDNPYDKILNRIERSIVERRKRRAHALLSPVFWEIYLIYKGQSFH